MATNTHEGILILITLALVLVALFCCFRCSRFRKSNVGGNVQQHELSDLGDRFDGSRSAPANATGFQEVELGNGRVRTSSSEELFAIQQLIHAKDEKHQKKAEDSLVRLAGTTETDSNVDTTGIDLTEDDELRVIRDLVNAETTGSPTDKLAANKRLIARSELNQDSVSSASKSVDLV